MPERISTTLLLDVDAETANRFLATCPNLNVGNAIDVDEHGRSKVLASGPIDAFAQAVAGTFEVHLSWSGSPPCGKRHLRDKNVW